MKLILSRKGFDSSYGGMPSPILPDGRLVPLPIPARHDRFTFRDLNYGNVPVEQLLHDLSRGALSADSTVHLDPDLDRPPAVRASGWRPSLGQTGTAQSHLQSNKITTGDAFLFFGWFREAELQNGKWRFCRSAPNIHAIFGWLEVGDMLPIVQQREACLRAAPWIADHPHVANPEHYADLRNTLYVAAEKSRFRKQAGFGGGRFNAISQSLRLTKENSSRSVWSLPDWFMPRPGETPLSYHGDPARWQLEHDRVTLQTVAKGQEFVLDCDHYPRAKKWLEKIVSENS